MEEVPREELTVEGINANPDCLWGMCILHADLGRRWLGHLGMHGGLYHNG